MGRPEIVIGLVGALGTDLPAVSDAIGTALATVGYKSDEVQLSKLLRDYPPPAPFKANLVESPEEERLNSYMTAGDELRAEMKRGDAMVLLSIARIRQLREETNGEADQPIPDHAFILRSLKHPDEVSTLRSVYGGSFFLVSAYSPKQQRLDALSRRIAVSHSVHHQEGHEGVALGLLERDEEEQDNPLGQQVRKTFWRGDAYINASTGREVNEHVKRLVELWFGHPFQTPTRDEYMMFCAQAAAYRSASLGRQVGAVIATSDGSIISTGTNEVPKAGGGQYWQDDHQDARDHIEGFDSSDTLRRGLLENLLGVLGKLGYLTEEKTNVDTHQLVEGLLYGSESALITSAEFNALTEYQRAVHAETAAIIDASRRGVSIEGATLYTTTFPCHGCARNIVAAGIRRVVYIEPYAKSLARTLHYDSIAIDSPCPGRNHVQFTPFVGLAPRRYMELFAMGTRKDDHGKAVRWQPDDAVPRISGWENMLAVGNEQKYLTQLSQWREHFRQEINNAVTNNKTGGDHE